MPTTAADVPSGVDRADGMDGTDPADAHRASAVVEALAGMALPSRYRDLAAEATGVLRWAVTPTARSTSPGRGAGLVAILDTAAAAARLVALLDRLGVDDGVVHAEPTRGRWRVVLGERQGPEVARRVGLADPGGRGATRLPSWLVAGSLPEAVATWRGVLLAAGRLAVPAAPAEAAGASVTVACPTGAVARDLSGLGLRLGIRARVVAGPGPVLRIDAPGDAALLLASCGGAVTLAAAGLTPPRTGPPAEGSAAANATRASVAASRTTTTVADAFAVLEAAGIDVPAALADAGRLRLRHPTRALVDLAALADPPSTKDALAGRLRRLAALAARHRPTGTDTRRR